MRRKYHKNISNKPISLLKCSEFLGHNLEKSQLRLAQINLINLIVSECKYYNTEIYKAVIFFFFVKSFLFFDIC